MIPPKPIKHSDFVILGLTVGRKEDTARWRWRGQQDKVNEAFRPLGDAFHWYDSKTGCRVGKVLQEVLIGHQRMQERP